MADNSKQTDMAYLALSTLTDRLRSIKGLGDTNDGKRNIYEQCGWPKTLSFMDYKHLFDRNDIAYRIIDAFPRACWTEVPSIKGSDGLESKWDKVVNFNEMGLFHYLYRADTMSGVGKYGAMFLGFDDGADPREPVSNASQLLFARPYFEADAQITQWEQDPTNPRYGLPVLYNLQPKQESMTKSITAHWTRVLHLAENTTSNDVYGTPRLQRVINRLYDMRKILGGSAEGFWRTGFPGLGLSLDKEVSLTEQQKDEMNDEAEDFVHGLTRLLRLQGVDMQELSSSPSDPSNHMEVQLACLSIATGIPIRILKGSERGELASTQDYRQWQDRNEERRKLYVTPIILKQLIKKLMSAGVLPEEEYEVEWTTPEESERERARIAREWSSALAAYASQDSVARDVIPPKEYLTTVWRVSEEKAEEIVKAVEVYKKKKFEEDKERAEMEAGAKDKGDESSNGEGQKGRGTYARPADGASKSSEEDSIK